MRLDKFLAESQAGQRKQVRSEIKEGNVSVNGVTIYEAAYEIDEEKQQLEQGIHIQGEGKKHQVKRMLRAIGCYVITLKKQRLQSLI